MEQLKSPESRPHVCFIAPYIWPVLADERGIDFVGGAEVQQTVLIRSLHDAGFRISVVTEVSGRPDEFELDGIRIIRLVRNGRELPVIRNIHPRLTSIWAALRRADADIYFQRCASANTLVGALFAKLNRRRFIYSGASDPDFERDQLWKKFPGRGGWRDQQMFTWGLQLADGIVAQHMGQAAACRRWYGRDAAEIPNCYAPSLANMRSRDGVVLWVSTIKSLKRPELFLEIARRNPQLRFCMVGGPATGTEAALYPQIEDAARHLPNVEFVGFVPYSEVESYFDRARIFVNTSDFEGFPNTFLQSWARGVPTVSFVDCGAREGGRSIGFVSSDLDDMSSTIAQLSHDDVLWACESERALMHFESNHSVRIAVTKYSRLFDKVLSGGGTA